MIISYKKIALIAGVLTTIGMVAVAAPFSVEASDPSAGCVVLPDPVRNTNGKYEAKMVGYFSASYKRVGNVATATITRNGDKPLCKDQPMILQSFKFSPNWNGKSDASGFWTSLPQTVAYTNEFVFGKSEKTKVVTVETPESCEGTQVDTYVGSSKDYGIVKTVDRKGEGPEGINLDTAAREIRGEIFIRNGECETPEIPETPETPDVDIEVCDPKTGNVITVNESDKSKYEAVSSDKCTKMQVCVKDSGNTSMKTITKDKFDGKKYSTNINDCKKPTIPEQPVPKGDNMPASIAKTGAADVIFNAVGLGSITMASLAYAASRKIFK